MSIFPPFRLKLTIRQFRILAFVLVGLMMLSMSLSSFAQTAPAPLGFNVLNGIGDVYKGSQKGWGDAIRVYAIRLFMLLASIDFGWMCVTFIMDKKELDDMMFSLGKKLMTLSFFLFLLMSSGTWIPQIIDSFTQIGRQAGHATAASPDGIVADGYDAALGVFQIVHELKLSEQLVAVLPAAVIALLMFLSFLFVAAQLLVALIESYIIIGGGVIMMGFGGSRWTTDMASKYMQSAVAIGIKLMVLYLVVGSGQALFSDIHLESGNEFFPSMFKALGAALVYAYLSIQVPAIANSMMSGSPSLSAGGMAGAVIGAGAAAAGVGAAAAATSKAGAGAVGGAAVAATGVAKAIGAGIDSGMDMGKSGAGLAAHAISEAGKQGLGLASGAIGDKIAGGASSFAAAVDGSAGGQVASSIQASRGGSMSGVPASAPSDSGALPVPGQAAPSGGAAPSVGSGSAPAAPQSGSAGSPGAASAGTLAGTQSGTSVDADGVQPPGATMTAGGAADNAGGAAAAPPPGQVGASAGSAAAQPSTPTANAPGVPPSAASAAPPAGDASTGSISGGGQQGASQDAGYKGKPDPLHRQIQDLKGYVPDDAAHAASINIDMKHAE